MDPPEQALVEVGAVALAAGWLFVGASKTDQEGRGAVLYLGPLFRRVRRGGRVEGDPGRRLSVNAIRRRGLDCRDADGGQVAVTGDAGPLCTGPVGSTGCRCSRPLRSRIKPGSTSSTITSLIGGGGVVVTLTSF